MAIFELKRRRLESTETGMKTLSLFLVASWLCVSSARANPDPEAGLYISNQECAATPDKGACVAQGTICVARAGGRTRGSVERRSRAFIDNGIPAGLRFDLASANLSGTYIAAYPTRGTRCKPEHEFPATASFGKSPSGGAFVELVVPAYRQLDLATCALGSSTNELKVRYYQVTDGSSCGSEAPTPAARTAEQPEARASTAPAKETMQLDCPSGPIEVRVEIVEGAQGTFYGLALTDRQGARSIVPERTLRLAQKQAGAQAEPPQLSWKAPDGETHHLGPSAFAMAACRGEPAANQRQLVPFLEKTIRDFVDRKCKGSRSCERKLKIQSSAGVRG
jgi:hypothetical protein